MKNLKLLLLLPVLSLALTGCQTWQWVGPGQIGVSVLWSQKDAEGNPKIVVTTAGQNAYWDGWYDSFGLYSNATQTSVFKSDDYKAPSPGFEGGIDCKDKGDNGITLNATVRWETDPETISKLVMEFPGIELRAGTPGDANDIENKVLKREIEAVAGLVCYQMVGIEMRTKIVDLSKAIFDQASPRLKKNGLHLIEVIVSAIQLDDKQDAIVRADSDQSLAATKTAFEQEQKIKSLNTQATVSAGQAEIDAEYIKTVVAAFDGDRQAAVVYIASRQQNISQITIVQRVDEVMNEAK